MDRGRGFSYAVFTSVAVVAGLLVLRLTVTSGSSVTYVFLANRLTYDSLASRFVMTAR
jgi:hypothetical protein